VAAKRRKKSTPRSIAARLRKCRERLAAPSGWHEIREGVAVKVFDGEEPGERFILCRSGDRRSKSAMHEKFSRRIETALERLQSRIARSKQPLDRADINRQIGRLLQRNSRAAARLEISLHDSDRFSLRMCAREEFDRWAQMSEGWYVLRTNIGDWTHEKLWKMYIQLTQAEAAFRIQKDQLRIRPIWHQRADRVQAHILVCFLAFVLWKTLEMWQSRAGLDNSPRTALEELARIHSNDVMLPTQTHGEIRLRCVTQPDPAPAALPTRHRVA
jgi:transposase